MRVAFMGTPEFAVPTLKALLDSRFEVCVVVTGPDKQAGRSLKVCPTPVKCAAEEAGIPILQPSDLNDPHFATELRSYEPDVGVVVAFRILPESVISIPRLGCLNLHPSLLPDLRGAAPINWALMRGYTRTGITTFLLEKRVDAGGIMSQIEVAINPEDNFETLSTKLCSLGADLIIETLVGMAAGTLHPQPQTGPVTRAPKITMETCCVDWSRPAEEIHNRIRGLSPKPGVYTSLGGKRLKIHKSRVLDLESAGEPGTVLSCQQGVIALNTGQGVLGLEEIQLEGKKRLKAVDFIIGRPLDPGTGLGIQK